MKEQEQLMKDWSGQSDHYRVWYGNWDAQVKPISIPEAVDDVESEMETAAEAMLVTRGDLNPKETLKAVDNLRQLIEVTIKHHE